MRTFSRYSAARSASTLVEVVAGMTLLASLVTGMLLAYGAHQKQLRRAQERIIAIDVCNELLARWYSENESIPRNRRGRVLSDQQRWVWQTATIELSAIGSMPVERIRVEVFKESNQLDRPPLAVVELVTPVEPPPIRALSRL